MSPNTKELKVHRGGNKFSFGAGMSDTDMRNS